MDILPPPPQDPAPQDPALPPPPIPAPPPHMTLIDRVTALEDRVAQLVRLHNRFADDVTQEIGL